MSRRQRTTITVSVTLPVPAGTTIKWTVDHIRDRLLQHLDKKYAGQEMIVRLTDRKTVYLN